MPDPLCASDLVTSAMLVHLTIDVVSCAAKMMMTLHRKIDQDLHRP
jgi:hypothetical protein